MRCKYIKHKACCKGRRTFRVCCFGLIVSLLLVCCDNHIIQRAASDYFPYEEGNWWRYVNNTNTLLVEVEPKDTILQIVYHPINFGGYMKYLAKNDKSVAEYVSMIYNFSGDDYTIIEDFIMRIELPLVTGNTYEDSLIDSLNISGQWVKAKYKTNGIISEDEYIDSLYSGYVYKIEIKTIQNLISSDTTIIDTTDVVEYYAPNIGLIRFRNEMGEYNLIEYEVQ